VQISDISSYATNQSYFSMKGVPPVARMGMSLGAENYNSDWQMYNQGWGDNMMGNRMGGNWSGGMNMMNNGRNSPRGNMMSMPMNQNFGNNSPRSYGNNSGSYGNSGSYQGSGGMMQSGNNAYKGMQYNGSGGMMQSNSPYGSPRGSPRMNYRM
jgi:hypothetical protein